MSMYCLNIKNVALTKFTGLSVSRLHRVGGTYYGVGPDGVYAMDDRTDDNAPITATVALATTDFDTDMRKRVTLTKLTSSGVAEVSVATDELTEPSLGAPTHDATVYKYGKGTTGRYIRVAVSSLDPDFTLWSLSTRVTPIRSIGGKQNA